MTCREFIEAAESLTSSELRLMETKDEQMSAHVSECAACSRWVESQRLLGNALHVLRDHTAGRQASPKVELAVLEAFRTKGFAPAAAIAPDRAAPAAWKLSRLFEVGAYAAVAAALIVGILLGARMWRDRQAPVVQVQAPATKAPPRVNVPGITIAESTIPAARVPENSARKAANTPAIKGAEHRAKQPQAAGEQTASTTVDRQGFVPLMLCDPLICSGEEQVIRVELPGSGLASADGNGGQPAIADVVVGDDGLVRAMRIVNQ